MLTVSVRQNIAAVSKTLSDVAKKQLPFAIAKGLTATAKDVQGYLAATLPRQLDKPTPFTQKAFAVTAAKKQSLTAKVTIKPLQWKYLKFQIEGGARKPAKRALIVPKALRLNQYGNMPRAAVKKLLAKEGVFSGTVDGVPGIYQRKGKVVKLVVAYAEKVVYKKRFPFHVLGLRAATKFFDKNFRQSLDQALATMR